MSDCLVSVLIPVYNQENFIKETLDSVLNQKSIDFPYEIIIANDASTDATSAVIEEWMSDKRCSVTLLNNPENLGLVKNVFHALTRCNGTYVALCGGDDVWTPDKLSEQMAFLVKNSEYGMLYSKAYKCNAIGEIQDLQDTEGEDFVSFEMLLKRNSIPASTAVIRKALLAQYIKEIDPANKPWVMEDYPLWLWCSKNTKIKFLTIPLAKYRILPESASHSRSYLKNQIFSVSRLNVIRFFHEKYSVRMTPSLLDSYYFNTVELLALQRNQKELQKLATEIVISTRGRRSLKALFSLCGCYFPSFFLYITAKRRRYISQ